MPLATLAVFHAGGVKLPHADAEGWLQPVPSFSAARLRGTP